MTSRRFQESLAGAAGAVCIKCCMVLVAAASSPARAETKVLDTVVARVNGEAITRSEVEGFLGQSSTGSKPPEENSGAWNAAVDELINRKLFLLEARRSGESVTREEINSELDRLSASYQSSQEFLAAMKLSGLTEEALRKRVEEDLTVRRFLEFQIKSRYVEPSLAEMESYYRENKERFRGAEKLKLRTIGVRCRSPEEREPARRKAEAILGQLREGADFAQLARQHSDEPSAERGGDVGSVERPALRPELATALAAMKAGDTSDVIELADSFQIVKLESVEPERDKSFEEVKELVREVLARTKREEGLRQLIGELKKKATIEIRN